MKNYNFDWQETLPLLSFPFCIPRGDCKRGWTEQISALNICSLGMFLINLTQAKEFGIWKIYVTPKYIFDTIVNIVLSFWHRANISQCCQYQQYWQYQKWWLGPKSKARLPMRPFGLRCLCRDQSSAYYVQTFNLTITDVIIIIPMIIVVTFKTPISNINP